MDFRTPSSGSCLASRIGGENLKIHVIGAGKIGWRRAYAAREMGVLGCVFDTDAQSAEGLANAAGTRATQNFLELADVTQPGDIVVIATPNSALAPLAMKMMGVGAHVLLEKPGGISWAELSEMRQRADEAGLVVRVGYNHRFHPGPRQVRQIIASGTFGAPILVRGHYGHGGRPGYEDEWRFNKAISGGGELLDQGCHLVDLVNFLVGRFTVKSALLSKLFWSRDVEDNAFLLGMAAESIPVNLHASWTEWKNSFSFEIFLQYGKLEIAGLGGSYGPERLVTHFMGDVSRVPDEDTIDFGGAEDTSWLLELEDFVAGIRGDDNSGASLTDGLHVLGEIERAYQIAGD